MENEMVERVARAMCEADGHHPDLELQHGADYRVLGLTCIHPTSTAFPAWHLYTGHARTAIKAMGQPTRAMVEAFENGTEGVFCGIGYDALITAALSPTQETKA